MGLRCGEGKYRNREVWVRCSGLLGGRVASWVARSGALPS
jgi:hypothetical protein